MGLSIVARALEEPARQIAQNCGKEGSVVIQEILKRKDNIGFNAQKEVFEDLVKAGVVDPKKVTRSALQYAASIAGLLLTMETLVTDIPEEESAPALPSGHPGMGGMGGIGGMGGMDMGGGF